MIKSDVVVVGIGPVHPLGIVPWMLSLIGKNIVFYSSWPYWDGTMWAYDWPVESLQRIFWYDMIKRVYTVGVTPTVVNAIEQRGGTGRYIPHCVNEDVFSPSEEETNSINVLFAGRLEKRKGVPLLLEVASEFPDDVNFSFAGDGYLSECVEKHQSGSYLGYLSKHEIVQAYSDADILVAPSKSTDGWTELFGIVLIEAMACGTPVVATDCPGPKEVVTDETGIIIDRSADRTKQELRRAISELLNNDEKRERMASQCRSYVESNFTTETVSSKWYETLETVAN